MTSPGETIVAIARPAVVALVVGLPIAAPARADLDCAGVPDAIMALRSQCAESPGQSPYCPFLDELLAEVVACCWSGGRYGIEDQTCLCDAFVPAGPVKNHQNMCKRD